MKTWTTESFPSTLCFLPSSLWKQQQRNFSPQFVDVLTMLTSFTDWSIETFNLITSSTRQNFENPHLLTRTYIDQNTITKTIYHLKQFYNERVWLWIIENDGQPARKTRHGMETLIEPEPWAVRSCQTSQIWSKWCFNEGCILFTNQGSVS